MVYPIPVPRSRPRLGIGLPPEEPYDPYAIHPSQQTPQFRQASSDVYVPRPEQQPPGYRNEPNPQAPVLVPAPVNPGQPPQPSPQPVGTRPSPYGPAQAQPITGSGLEPQPGAAFPRITAPLPKQGDEPDSTPGIAANVFAMQKMGIGLPHDPSRQSKNVIDFKQPSADIDAVRSMDQLQAVAAKYGVTPSDFAKQMQKVRFWLRSDDPELLLSAGVVDMRRIIGRAYGIDPDTNLGRPGATMFRDQPETYRKFGMKDPTVTEAARQARISPAAPLPPADHWWQRIFQKT